MEAETFRRARTPEQRDARREKILSTTREMLRESRVADTSLNEIARRVGLAKSNILRYFGSRESIMLTLTRQEYEAWVDDVAAAAPGEALDPVGFASILARTATNRPLLCDLLTCLAIVLEHNVTPAEIIEFKVSLYPQIDRLLAILNTHIGPVDAASRRPLIIAVHAVITECWALSHPAPALVAAAQQDPRIMASPTDPQSELTHALALLLRGAAPAHQLNQ